MSGMGEISRRAVLGVGLGVAAGTFGCASPPDSRPRTTPSTTPSASATAEPTVTPGATGPPTASAPTPTTSSAPNLPSRTSIIARYDGVAPHHWGLTGPGIVERLSTRKNVVALTFDACGGPQQRGAGSKVDQALVDLLRRHNCKATLFLNSRWIAANPRVTDELVADPLFEIANHGTRHLPLSVTGRSAYGIAGTRSVGEVYDEVAGNHRTLSALLGRPARFFRSGTAYADDVATRIAADLGETVVNFSVNGDGGATFSANQVATALGTAGAGDIVISHMNRPERQTAKGYARGLPRLLDRGLSTVTLSEYLT